MEVEMKINKKFFGVLILLGIFLFSGCYTQLKLEEDDDSYRKERKKVIIEKRIEKDGEIVEDTSYESSDGEVEEEEEETYYYPRHRRSYKFYHPGITIVVGGAVFYDPWYFDYFYYPYTICRTYYLPWWWGYYSCYRVWYGFTYYDPFYNPFYSPPYWWYDPYWYGGSYPPIVQYRKNDFTRLRNNDGGRSGSVITGNWGRDLNLQIANARSRTRNSEIPGLRNINSRNVRTREGEINLRTPTQKTPGSIRDRDSKTTIPKDRKRVNESKIPRIDDRNKQNPGLPERKDVQEKGTRNPDRTPNTDRKKESPPTRRFDSFSPSLDREIIINRKSNEINERLNNKEIVPQNKNFDKSYRKERIRIEYDVPRREYVPRIIENNRSNTENTSRINSTNDNRQQYSPTPRYERRNESPRYEAPQYEPPRYQTPSRNNYPTYTPPQRISPPPVYQAPATDRRRDR